MNDVKLTFEKIEACESLAHAYTVKTLKALGAEFTVQGSLWPAPGWKSILVGKVISGEKYQEALDSRSKGFFKNQASKRQSTF